MDFCKINQITPPVRRNEDMRYGALSSFLIAVAQMTISCETCGLIHFEIGIDTFCILENHIFKLTNTFCNMNEDAVWCSI